MIPVANTCFSLCFFFHILLFKQLLLLPWLVPSSGVAGIADDLILLLKQQGALFQKMKVGARMSHDYMIQELIRMWRKSEMEK